MKRILLLSLFIATTFLNAQVVKQITKDKTDLDFTNEIALSNSLNHLIKKVKNKKIVAIGEDTHGTSEYYKARLEITKKLVIEKGFNTIILENPYGDIEMLVNNIQTENLDSLMTKHLFSIYQTKELKTFLLWFKEYSSTHKDIRFKGCDDSFGQMFQLLENELLPSNNSQIKSLLKEFKERYVYSFEEYYKNKQEEVPKNTTYFSYGKELYDLILELEKTIITEGLQTPLINEYLFNLKNTFINYKTIPEGITRSRDEIMAERISYFSNQPNAKIIIWAHNAHISKTIIIDNEIGMMGKNLKKEFEDDYYAIGLSTNSGTYSFIEEKYINGDRIYDEELYQDTLVFSKTNSWEQLFSEVESDAYYFEFNKYSRIRFKNARAKYLKLLGYNIESDKDYYLLYPQEMFDAIIFIKETTATIPLFGDAKLKRERLYLVNLKYNDTVTNENNIPKKWHNVGSKPKSYIMRIDDSEAFTGKKSILIESKVATEIDGFGTLMRSIPVKDYLGKKIKLSGYLKTENITGWAGLWMRVDGKNRALSFNNMYDKAIKGSTNWTQYEITLDVPKKAIYIGFGGLIDGNGKLWFDNLKIELIDNNNSIDDSKTINFDFEN
ncbi:MAG: hypothetical protein COB12_11555 [Flavobacterium sp.]|nr:MAG: hypothetical protein COB12_11555 [Flavobacterium sp.]